ncbi:ubiquinol-cytochrome C chaperone family protein [Rhizobium helianthi]|uniref:Ubiquinol-cytochrome C chaperone family protein n=1 Tax=Rhizobium helianthi TaxID=1132695 RepID=A0ABW4LXQ6_9HYPH
MIFNFFRKNKSNRAIVDRQYETLTSTARIPFFYSDMDVPDTVMGRFEMLCLVMILFFRRTGKSGVSGQELAQEIIDAFFQDIDHSIRELGIGDQSVPKRMKKLAGMFYGRVQSYGDALGSADLVALAEALRRNIHPGEEAAPAMLGLARWALRTEGDLSAVTEDEIAHGTLMLPAPTNEDLQ